MITTANLAASPAATWAPNPAAGAQHWRSYCIANAIDPVRWAEERRPPKADALDVPEARA